MECHSTVLLVAKIDVDERVFEEHPRILEACRPARRTRVMQHHTLEMVDCVHLERGGDVLAHSGFAGTRTSALAKLQVAGGAAVPLEQALERLLAAKGKVDTEECRAALGASWTSLRQRHCGGDSELRTGCVQLCRRVGFVRRSCRGGWTRSEQGE